MNLSDENKADNQSTQKHKTNMGRYASEQTRKRFKPNKNTLQAQTGKPVKTHKETPIQTKKRSKPQGSAFKTNKETIQAIQANISKQTRICAMMRDLTCDTNAWTFRFSPWHVVREKVWILGMGWLGHEG